MTRWVSVSATRRRVASRLPNVSAVTGHFVMSVSDWYPLSEELLFEEDRHVVGCCHLSALGRPLNDPLALDKARQWLGRGMGINKVARQVGLSNSTVARLKAEMIASP